MPSKIYGIDFSGSKSPGKKIWITEAAIPDTPNPSLRIQHIRSAAELFSATHRSEILNELCDFIRQTNDAIIGLDFPFGLPQSAVSVEGWNEFIEEFAKTFDNQNVEAYPGPFKPDTQSKREIDFRFGGQSPVSPQIKYQVFYGVRDVLHPLVTDNSVRVLPMQQRDTTKPTLLEVYPAATFGVERLYRTGYKDNSHQSQQRRRVNARGLQSHEKVSIEEQLVNKAIQSEDALDSLCAAFAVRRALAEGLDREQESVEGHIYV